MTIIIQSEDEFMNYKQLEYSIPFQGYRRWVAFAYMGVNAIGFAANFWVLYTVAPLLFSSTVKVPKSILFYIMTLCISDLMIMTVVGTWKFSTVSCVAYLVFEAMNKFVAPVIVVLISRTCYVTVCLDPKICNSTSNHIDGTCNDNVMASFAYSQVSTLYFNANITQRTVNVLRKCTFMPPSEIELGFGIVSCIASYAIPLGGIIYWYVSVPFFCENMRTIRLHLATPLRRLVATVLVLTAVYVSCWSPYWLSIFAHKFISRMSRTVVVVSYYIHLLPYISCSAYPVIFTLLNRRIKMARAQMHLHQKRPKFTFIKSSQNTEQQYSTRTSIGSFKILRICVEFLPTFSHQNITPVDSANGHDSTTNQYIGNELKYSIKDSAESGKSLNTVRINEVTQAITVYTPSLQDAQQSLETIEMQEDDFLL
ncbi:putative G-protein coupled receptor npr-29 [Dirofilaria immitis]|nr:putative G-protein coupled receptor npr-29 [Dirofilaria immitis]